MGSAATWLILTAWCPPALAQSSANQPAPKPATAQRVLTYGAEISLGSGHADRGFIISDRPVVQPAAWITWHGAELSFWSSFTVARTTEGARPQIFELELTREQHWGHVTVAPAVTAFSYRDPLSIDRDRSVEGWLHLSYAAGPVRLFTDQSFDVLTYRGAYSGAAGVESERRVSPRVTIGGSLTAGWGSATFNDAYAGVPKSALDRIGIEGWVTTYLAPGWYLTPLFEFSTIVDPTLRAALSRPSFVRVAIAAGVER